MGHDRLDTTQIYLSDVASYLARARQPVNVAAGASVILEHLCAPPDAIRAPNAAGRHRRACDVDHMAGLQRPRPYRERRGLGGRTLRGGRDRRVTDKAG
jgi:hypothetical protein